MSGKTPWQERNIALIYFLFFTGCRTIEVTRLKIDKINLKKNSAEVLGKGDKGRTVYFTDDVKTALLEYWKVRKTRSPNDYAFSPHGDNHHDRGDHITTRTVRRIVYNACDFAGVDHAVFSAHGFRHNFVTTFYAFQKDIYMTQTVAGSRGCKRYPYVRSTKR